MADPKTIQVNVPDVGLVDFPADWTDQQIEQHAHKVRLDYNNSKPISDRGMHGETGPEAAMRGAGVLASNIVPGVISTVRAPYDIGKSLYNEGVVQTGKNMASGLVQSGKDLVSGDPERAGRVSGQLIGSTLVPIGLKGVAPAFKGTANALVRGGSRLQEIGESLPTHTPAITMTGSIERALVKPGLKGAGSVMEKVGRTAGGDLPFARRPLYKQMEGLPTENVGPVSDARTPSPPMNTETPFHEKPLYAQMNDIPTDPRITGEMPTDPRGPVPPIQKLGHESPLMPGQAPPRLVKQGAQSPVDVLLQKAREALPNAPEPSAPGLPPAGENPAISGLAHDMPGNPLLKDVMENKAPDAMASTRMYHQLKEAGYADGTAKRISGYTGMEAPVDDALFAENVTRENLTNRLSPMRYGTKPPTAHEIADLMARGNKARGR